MARTGAPLRLALCAVVVTFVGVACTKSPDASFEPIAIGGAGVEVISMGHPAMEIATGLGFAWVLESSSQERWYIERIDPGTLDVLPDAFGVAGPHVSSFAVGAGGVWLSMPTLSDGHWGDEPGRVLRLDPESGRTMAEIRVGRHPGGIVIGSGSVWVANTEEDTVSRIDSTNNRVVATIPVGHGPDEVVFAFGTLWVANGFGQQSVMRIDPRTNEVVAEIRDVARPVVGDGVMWVVGPGRPNGAILQIDPRTNGFVGDPLPLDIGPGYVTAGEGRVWIGKWYDEPSPPACPDDADCPVPGTFEYRLYDPEQARLYGPRIVVNGPTAGTVGLGGVWFPGGGLKRVLWGSANADDG